MTRRRRALLVIVALVALAVPFAGPAGAAKPGGGGTTTTYPASVAALGDSITRGFNAAGWFSDWPSRSWATGTDTAVNSVYSRIKAKNRKAVAYNNARTGAEVAELPGQASAAVAQRAQHVTVLIGANDACTDTTAAMTSVESFQASLTAAFTTLGQAASPPTVMVSSIPSLQQLWSIGKDSASARSAWASYDICPSMLANPQSTSAEDVTRRQLVQERVEAFNAELAAACTVYGTRCRYDDGAVFGYPFSASHISTWDYFHPSTAGQAVLARTVNEATWKW